jgi:hypothetical protein
MTNWYLIFSHIFVILGLTLLQMKVGSMPGVWPACPVKPSLLEGNFFATPRNL